MQQLQGVLQRVQSALLQPAPLFGKTAEHFMGCAARISRAALNVLCLLRGKTVNCSSYSITKHLCYTVPAYYSIPYTNITIRVCALQGQLSARRGPAALSPRHLKQLQPPLQATRRQKKTIVSTDVQPVASSATPLTLLTDSQEDHARPHPQRSRGIRVCQPGEPRGPSQQRAPRSTCDHDEAHHRERHRGPRR